MPYQLVFGFLGFRRVTGLRLVLGSVCRISVMVTLNLHDSSAGLPKFITTVCMYVCMYGFVHQPLDHKPSGLVMTPSLCLLSSYSKHLSTAVKTE